MSSGDSRTGRRAFLFLFTYLLCLLLQLAVEPGHTVSGGIRPIVCRRRKADASSKKLAGRYLRLRGGRAAITSDSEYTTYRPKNPCIVEYLPEDVVEYRIFLDEISLANGTDPLAHDSAKSRLNEVRRQVLEFASTWTKDYLWQHNGFNLKPFKPTTKLLDHMRTNPIISGLGNQDTEDEAEQVPVLPHLIGRTTFGNNIEDEWFIVWLLLVITRRFPDITAHVIDSDGQFLLVEAAEMVPRYLKPENCINRLFIRNGTFVVIADSVPVPEDLKKTTGRIRVKYPRISPEKGVFLARTGRNILPKRHLRRINEVLFGRLQEYPDKIKVQNMHHKRVVMPLKVAHVLRARPQLLPLVVEAFIERHWKETEVASMHKNFNVTPLVAHRVRFSRMRYAQLKAQKFYASQPFGDVLKQRNGSKDPEADAQLLGVRLAMGLEILYNRELEKGAEFVEESLGNLTRRDLPDEEELEEAALLGPVSVNNSDILKTFADNLQFDSGYRSYRRKLARTGYFGSRVENDTVILMDVPDFEREFKARVGYLKHLKAAQTPEMDNKTEIDLRYPVYGMIRDALRESTPNASTFRKFEELPAGDSDLWMHVSPEELKVIEENKRNAEIAEEEGIFGMGKLMRDAAMGAADNASVVERIKHFLFKEKSSFDGIEAPGERHRFKPVDSEYDDDELFSMRDMMHALDREVEDGNRTSSWNRSQNFDSYTASESDPRFSRSRKLIMPNDETSVWSELSVAATESGDIPRAHIPDYVEVMDHQLSQHKELRDFETSRPGEDPENLDGKVDVEYNLAKNWVRAVAEEDGTVGPAGQVLRSLGIENQFRLEQAGRGVHSRPNPPSPRRNDDAMDAENFADNEWSSSDHRFDDRIN